MLGASARGMHTVMQQRVRNPVTGWCGFLVIVFAILPMTCIKPGQNYTDTSATKPTKESQVVTASPWLIEEDDVRGQMQVRCGPPKPSAGYGDPRLLDGLAWLSHLRTHSR